MNSLSTARLAFALTLLAGPAAAQSGAGAATTAAQPAGAPGTPAAGAVNAGSAGSATGGAPTVGAIGPAAGAAPSAPPAAASAAEAAASPASAPAAPAASARPVARPAAAGSASPARRSAPRAPDATLNGAAKGVAEARRAELAGGDELSVSRELDKVYAAAASRPGAPVGGVVSGLEPSVRQTIARKVSLANSESPENAARLYADAIAKAKETLPPDIAAGQIAVVRRYAAAKAGLLSTDPKKAGALFDDLAAKAFEFEAARPARSRDSGAGSMAAAGTGAAAANPFLGALRDWQGLELLGPERRLIPELPLLESSVEEAGRSAEAGRAGAAPRVTVSRSKDGTLALNGIPIPRQAPLILALKPAALSGPGVLAEIHAAFLSDPSVSAAYRAARSRGASVPEAALSAARYWPLEAFERLAALLSGPRSYDLTRPAGQDALRRDAALSLAARADSAAAERLLSPRRLTVGEARAALAAAARAAADLSWLDRRAAGAAVETRRAAFESSVAALAPGDEVPAAASAPLIGPGGLLHWTELISGRARAAAPGVLTLSAAPGLIDLAAGGKAADAASLALRFGAPLSFAALGDQLWARGRGARGEVRLAATLRGTDAGGSIDLSVESGDAALARRLEDLGFVVAAGGAGLRAAVAPGDFSRDAAELSALAVEGLAAADGAASAPGSADLLVRALARQVLRDPAAAAKLARRYDGRQAFARAPVLGYVGRYEAVEVGGVDALRDPDASGLLRYAARSASSSAR